MHVCVQVVLRGPDVGDLHAGRVPVPWDPSGGALQAAEGGTSNGQTDQLHTRAVGVFTVAPCWPGGSSTPLYPRWLAGVSRPSLCSCNVRCDVTVRPAVAFAGT